GTGEWPGRSARRQRFGSPEPGTGSWVGVSPKDVFRIDSGPGSIVIGDTKEVDRDGVVLGVRGPLVGLVPLDRAGGRFLGAGHLGHCGSGALGSWWTSRAGRARGPGRAGNAACAMATGRSAADGSNGGDPRPGL